MKTIQERALESLESQKSNLLYGYAHYSQHHKEQADRKLEIISYLTALVNADGGSNA